MSDDFEFLTIVASASNMTVVFEPLVGRYVRPFVVLMYYVCFRMFGLTAWPYHVAALAPHLLNSYLVFLVARRVLPDRGWLSPFLAGLLFLLFSSHSEAVAWPAGIADPILTTFLLTAFLFYLRGTAAETSAWWIAASWAAMCGAALAKELWVIFPLIVLAHAALLGERTPTSRRRAAALVGCGLATVVIYLAMRRVVFGSIAGGYAGLGTSIRAGIWLMEFRAFVLRCFVPAGTWAVRLWLHVPLVIWVLAGAVLIAIARSRARRVMLFAGAAMLLALAPVLPLTISVASTESERFTYFATAFSSLLIVAAASTIMRHRVAVSIACALLIAWHATVLAQAGARRERWPGRSSRASQSRSGSTIPIVATRSSC